jgi:hypothetical protein
MTDHRFVRARFLAARFATKPLLDEWRAQRAMWCVRSAETEQPRADGVVLVSGE